MIVSKGTNMTEKESSESLVNEAIRKTNEVVAELSRKVKSGTPLTQKEIVGIDDLLIGVRGLKILMMKRMRFEGVTYSEIGKVFGMTRVNAFYLINK